MNLREVFQVIQSLTFEFSVPRDGARWPSLRPRCRISIDPHQECTEQAPWGSSNPQDKPASTKPADDAQADDFIEVFKFEQ